MTKVRDTKRTSVYEAESLVRRMFDLADERGLRTVEVAGSHVTLPVERRFASLESAQQYVDKVLALNWVRERWPRAALPVRVRARSGNTAAHYENDCATIALPVHRDNRAWAFRELVVLHELAHHLDPQDPDDPTEPAHGPAFVDRFLTLVDEIIGPEAAFMLRASGIAVRE
ncbi:putative metallohydrolase (TIGR04338 family) [Rhodococcus sp. SMB37]|uniref:TIGR04338 family metallohydrolase n=1 Tax=Rhodococcus sp. SMB37 TaxID=2512213 RepID=UPI0010523171|nr:TIGR04338 family metallohydrolase [Rhodococcus sp. SMB37]TCN45868.1 putative metallohydrolase (TIGR04338 family) [Rhodococcus sp. SMB37]